MPSLSDVLRDPGGEPFRIRYHGLGIGWAEKGVEGSRLASRLTG
jgi:hypothetical protein